MNPSNQEQLNELRCLIAEVREGQPDAAHMRRLQRLLDESAEARRMYARYGSMQVLLELAVAGMDAHRPDEIPAELPAGWLPATVEELEDYELPPTVNPILGFLGSAYQGTIGFFSQEIPFALLIATVITGLGLWAGSLVYVNQPKPMAKKSSLPREHVIKSLGDRVGQITEMAACRWDAKGSKNTNAAARTAASANAYVFLGDQFSIASGLMEITYDTGAKVILQGPATYEVDSRDGGFLAVGKLTARLEKRGEKREESAEKVASGQWPVASETNPKSRNPEIPKSPAPRPQSPTPTFAVRTPTAIVTDLGTEFGVEVDEQGTTTSHVFQGSVRLQMVSSSGKVQGDAQVLQANQSARVEIDRKSAQSKPRVLMLDKSTKAIHFVRTMPRPTIKYLDLVDVVAGGDGFSNRRNRGINPADGELTDKPPKDFHIHSDGQYHRVAKQPLIDGVFIPDPQGPVQVDSAGHKFSGLVASTNMTFGYIWAGGQVPTSCPPPVKTKMDEIDYSLPGHGLIFLHADKGITFDLEAIRRANPDCRLKRFLAAVGNTEIASQGILGPLSEEESKRVFADVWVLVDGQPRFRRREINGYSGSFSVDVAIGKKDHYLTLIGSDGGNHIHADWILFGDPRIELLSFPSEIENDNTDK